MINIIQQSIKFKNAISILIFACFFQTLHAQTIYVGPWDPIRIPPGGSTCTWQAQDLTSNGSSPATAYASFKGAWDKALSNNAAGQIIQFLPDTYLQGYDYDTNGNTDNCTDATVDASATVNSSTANIKIYGDNTGCGTFIKAASGTGTFLKIGGTTGDNVEVKNIYLYNWGQGMEIKNSQNVLIENCVFDNVNQQGAAGVYILCENRKTKVTFKNCKFVNNVNKPKCAVDINRTSTATADSLVVKFIDCDFVCNSNTSYGGALTINGQQGVVKVDITGGTFSGNSTSAAQGGAISIGSLSGTNDPFVNLTDVNFYNNDCKGASTGASDGGGAIHAGQKTTLNIFGGVFYGNICSNSSKGNGGAIQCAGAGSATKVTLNINATGTKNTLFGNNTGKNGGGIGIRNTNAYVRNVAFNGNVATTGQALDVINAGGVMNIDYMSYNGQTHTNSGGGTLTEGANSGPLYTAPSNVASYACNAYCAVTVPGACSLMHSSSAGTNATSVCFSAANGQISGKAFNDSSDKDGINNNSSPIANMYVLLYNIDGDVIARTTTNASGNYTFTGIPTGQYYVVFTPISSVQYATYKDIGSTQTDSDADGSTFKSFIITIDNALSNTNSNDETTAALIQTNVDAGFSTTVLPVELLSFTGKKWKSNSNLLNWNVASEVNFKEYQLERSIDKNNNFKTIGIINAENKANYIYTDNNLSNGVSYYYRLKMVDLNGAFEYSPIVKINSSLIGINVLPNPVKGLLNITFENIDEKPTFINVINMKGDVLTVPVINGKQVDLSAFANGIYILKYNDYISTRVIKY
jgi:hypothetical protein